MSASVTEAHVIQTHNSLIVQTINFHGDITGSKTEIAKLVQEQA
jgi:hypothetical protein